MIVNPDKLSVKERYQLMISSIVPRPIAFVSTISPDGIPNLAPFSYFNGITSTPPTLCFAPGRNKDGGKKDTLVNLEKSGTFAVNMVTEEMVQQMAITATSFPADTNEFEQAGLTALSCQKIEAPRVGESPLSMECKVLQILEIGAQSAGGGFLVIGQVLLFHVKDEFIKNGNIRVDQMKPVGRLGDNYLTTLGKIFSIKTNKP